MAIIDTIIQSLDLVDFISNYTKLKKANDGYRGCCPLHNGDNPNSFHIFNDKSFYCFSCGKGGNIINFLQEAEGMNYNEAIEYLASQANIDIALDSDYQREKTFFEKNQAIAHKAYQNRAVIKDWLIQERGLTESTIDSFYLGYNKDKNGKNVLIPLHDKNGRIVAFCKRYLDFLPKYINSTNNELYEKGEFLFNAYRASKMLQSYQRLYICEGYMDAMSAYQQGLACVAYCGSELSKEQIQEIKKMIAHTPNIVIMYAPDNDEVGLSKISRVWDKFNELAPRLDVRVVKFPNDCKDFNEIILSGRDIASLESEPIALASIKQELNACFDKQQEFIVASEKIRLVGNPLIKSEIIEYLAQRWDKPISDIKEISSINFTDNELVNDFKSVDDCFCDYINLINEESLGIGFPSLDTALKLRPSDVVFWAGYSNTYKTMIACEVALYNAIRLKKNVLFFSLEMSAGSLYERMIARILRKSSDEIEAMAKDGKQAFLLEKIKQALKEHLYIVDKSNLTIKDIEKYILIANNRIIKNGKVDYVILDYFQYLNMQGFEEIAESAKYTKVIAKNSNIVFFILSQLNRTGENHSKPTIKMLKGSGDLEASADYVALSWRAEFDPSLTYEQREELKNRLYVYIGKARRGAKVTEFEFLYNTDESRMIDLGVVEENKGVDNDTRRNN